MKHYLLLATTMLILVNYSHANTINKSDNNDQAKQGKALWNSSFSSTLSPTKRSCTSCHTNNLKQQGKHLLTGKTITPMAPSVNKFRLTKPKKVKKWFKRNCKWTLGRECSEQEKKNLLAFIKQQ